MTRTGHGGSVRIVRKWPETELPATFGETTMRTKRLLGAAAAATIAAIAPLSATIAHAAEPTGVGSGTVSATVLGVDVGNVLSVKVLTDHGTSTIDPKDGASSSSTGITPLTITSGAVPALNVTTPTVGTSSTGAEDKKSVSPDLPDNPAFSGQLKADLSSVVDTVGARSGLDATLSNLQVAGGLLDVPSAVVSLSTNAASGEASATRSISIPSIDVLNLAAVLKAVGLPLESLPLDDLTGLLGSLGIPLPDIDDPAAVVATVSDALDALQGQSGALTPAICSQVDGLLGTVGGLTGADAVADAADKIVDTITNSTPGLPSVPALPTLQAQALPSCADVTGTVQDLVDQLQGVVAGVVTSVLATLGDTSLLSVQGIDVGRVADAKSSVDSSVAKVTGTVGSVKVGNIALPALSGLDLGAAASVLSAAGDTVSSAIGDVLGVVNAQLADMVDVDVLKITEQVAPDGDYASATAGVTALTAKITPPDLLTGAIAVSDTASDLLDQVSTAVPAVAPLMTSLQTALNGLDLLTGPATITVGQLSSTSAFRPVTASVPGVGSTPTGELPRTGTNAAIPAMAAVLVGGVALGIRRFLLALAS
jgi:hypothetical protein